MTGQGVRAQAQAGALAARIARPLPPGLEPRRAALAEAIEAAGGTAPAGRLARRLERTPVLARFLEDVFALSPHLRELARLDLDRLERVLEADPAAHVEGLIAALPGQMARAGADAEAMAILRRFKAEAALTIALADLGGVIDVDTMTRLMTLVADAALAMAVRHLLADAARAGRLHPGDPQRPEAGSGYVVLAMGKQGAFELNYSSDVDLIVLYDPGIAPLAEGVEPATFFVRLTKRLVSLMQERTAEGYVFRTDLRLRPDPGATPIAISLPAALQYYESLGQNWERAALIKARPCAGDLAAGERFLEEIRPFIWRKYLDYAAISDVHSIKRQIHAVKGHGAIAVAGHNIKLGRGGIREIEFFVQTQQLIAGGRDPALRGRQTLAMLGALEEAGWIDEGTREDLSAAYRFLRRLEHRLQMIGDEQTHSLPDTEEGLAALARLMGYGDTTAFATTLIGHLQRVQTRYAKLFEEAPPLSSELGSLVFTGDEDDPDTLATLARLGFRAPKEVTAGIRAWHFGRYPAMRSQQARERLTELAPALVAALAATANPDQAFAAFDRFLSRLPAGVQLFSLLRSNPGLLSLLATVMGTAPQLAETVTRRPHVVDAVLEPAFFGTLPDIEEMRRRLTATLAEARSYEEALDRARIFGQEQIFLIGVRILSGTISAERAGAAYTALADLVVATLYSLAGRELERVHGALPGGASAVLAMGKLGGREMTATSDLDLILLYDFDREADASSGARPIGGTQYYIRLTQRLVAALSAPTAEGRLYDVDLRLRPSGNAGPLATSIGAFETYQREDAWTWEHMALTRARILCGDPGITTRAQKAIRQTLMLRRDPDRVRADVASMRARIAREKGDSAVWDFKLVRGGLLDIEFIAQALVLIHAHARPEIMDTGTRIVLERAAAAGLLAPGDAEILIPACRLYHDLTHISRLCLTGRQTPEEASEDFRMLLARSAGLPDFATLVAHLGETRSAVRATFERLIGTVGSE